MLRDMVMIFRDNLRLAAAATDTRMSAGFVQVLAPRPGHWQVRSMACRDPQRAVRSERRALALWLRVSAFGAATGAFGLFAAPLHRLAGIAGQSGRLLYEGASPAMAAAA